LTETPLLEVDNLRKTFGGIVAVDGASFDIEQGTITGLIGPNGAGKTTTFNCISGFYGFDDGEIRFKGTDIQDIMGPSAEEQGIWASSSAVTIGGLGLAAGAVTLGSVPAMAGGLAAGAALGVGSYYAQEHVQAEYTDVQRSRPFQLSHEGLVRTFQITRELQGMTVLENLMLAPKEQVGEHLLRTWFAPGRVAEREDEVLAEARDMLELLEIEHLANEQAGNLSGGQRKLLELGRVLMTDPELILLDEPVAGVNPTLTAKLLERIEDLRDEGYTFLIVEHDMEVIMNLSDTIIVMANGDTLMEGTADEVRQDDRVIEAYLGG
jgi:branched-chain amino acid transport system ATP-binding protein